LKNFPTDVAISWETPSAFNDPKIKKNVKLKLCEMQVCHLSDKEMVAAAENLDYMCTLSQWHRKFIVHSGLRMPFEKVIVFPNGIRLERYKKSDFEAKIDKKIKNNPKFVYSSSPDRGLWYLLQMWPYIREEFPKAELSVCYGLEDWVNAVKWSHGRIAEMALGIIELLNQPGIKNLGKIGQDQLAKLQMEADAWLYPFDPMSPTESGCISAIENAAAGNPIITTDADCMELEFGKFGYIVKLPFYPKEFAEKTIEILHDTDYMKHMRIEGRKFAEKRDWNLIANQWLEFFKEEVK